jgi:hypothetical protein
MKAASLRSKKPVLGGIGVFQLSLGRNEHCAIDDGRPDNAATMSQIGIRASRNSIDIEKCSVKLEPRLMQIWITG